MKTTTNLMFALALTSLIAAPAVAGTCGSSTAKASQASADQTPAIAELADQAGFSTLTAAIAAAGLTETLNTDGPFTVFAPTDAAFARLPEGTLEALLADKEALTRVLLFHVTSGNVYAKDVVELSEASTLNGEQLAINLEDGVMVNDANVIKTDVEARNGVIHVIDSVLIPANL